jgi:HK97 gp10 family phage protein
MGVSARQLANALQEAVDAALIESGAIIARRAQEMAPYDTGRLRNSITYATRTASSRVESPALLVDGVKHDGSENTVVVGTAVEYARYQEYGTKHMPSMSYLRGALSVTQKAVEKTFADNIRRKLESLWGGS